MHTIKVIPLSKDYILSQVSQIDILAHYLNLSSSAIEEAIKTRRPIISRQRKDTNPSLGFYVGKNGMVYAKDFGGTGFRADCFDAVAHSMHITTPLNGEDFMLVLEEIRNTFISQHRSTRIAVPSMSDYQLFPNQYDYYLRDWIKIDKAYWNSIYIPLETLTKFNVHPLFEFYINNKLVYHFNYNDPAYIYLFTEDAFQVYFPFRDKKDGTKFITNKWIVQNGINVTKAKVGIITKSYKDVMFLHNYCHLGIQAVAPPTETSLLTPEQMNYLRDHWEIIYTLSDYDRTGYLFALRMQKSYNTIPLFLTNGLRNTVNFRHKDPTDFVKHEGKAKFDSLVEYLLKHPIINNYEHFVAYCENIGFYRYGSLQDVPFL